jgi:hypothetical protein
MARLEGEEFYHLNPPTNPPLQKNVTGLVRAFVAARRNTNRRRPWAARTDAAAAASGLLRSALEDADAPLGLATDAASQAGRRRALSRAGRRRALSRAGRLDGCTATLPWLSLSVPHRPIAG